MNQPSMNPAVAAPMERPQLEYTAERVVPGVTPEPTFREHQMRYAFAAQFVPGRTVLDIACGSGIGTDYLRKAGARICFGLDLDLPALRYAKSRFRLPHLAACDANRICLASQSVEVVVSFETIEHLEDPRSFLVECERLLRPGGLLVCSTPNREITRWDGTNPFHMAEMPIHDFFRQVDGIFEDCVLYGQSPVSYPLHVAKRGIISMLQTLHLKQLVRRCSGPSVTPVCSEVEFVDDKGDGRYAVSPVMPRWPQKPRYAIVVARKSAKAC